LRIQAWASLIPFSGGHSYSEPIGSLNRFIVNSIFADCKCPPGLDLGLVAILRVAFEVFLRQLASGTPFTGELLVDVGVSHAGSFHRTADFETYGQDEHYAAGIGGIFGMMAEHMQCRADVDRP